MRLPVAPVDTRFLYTYGPVLRNPTIKKLHLAELLANLKKVGRALTPPAPFSAKGMGRSHHIEIPPIEL